MTKGRKLVIGAIALLHCAAFLFAYENSRKNRLETTTKFSKGDCVRHNSLDKVDFFILGIEKEKYKLGAYDEDTPAYVLSKNPPYSLTNYMDKFYLKTKCPSNVRFDKVLQIEKDPLYSIRSLLMRSDLKLVD